MKKSIMVAIPLLLILGYFAFKLVDSYLGISNIGNSRVLCARRISDLKEAFVAYKEVYGNLPIQATIAEDFILTDKQYDNLLKLLASDSITMGLLDTESDVRNYTDPWQAKRFKVAFDGDRDGRINQNLIDQNAQWLTTDSGFAIWLDLEIDNKDGDRESVP